MTNSNTNTNENLEYLTALMAFGVANISERDEFYMESYGCSYEDYIKNNKSESIEFSV